MDIQFIFRFNRLIRFYFKKFIIPKTPKHHGNETWIAHIIYFTKNIFSPESPAKGFHYKKTRLRLSRILCSNHLKLLWHVVLYMVDFQVGEKSLVCTRLSHPCLGKFSHLCLKRLKRKTYNLFCAHVELCKDKPIQRGKIL